MEDRQQRSLEKTNTLEQLRGGFQPEPSFFVGTASVELICLYIVVTFLISVRHRPGGKDLVSKGLDLNELSKFIRISYRRGQFLK